MKKTTTSQPGARRLAVALALCAALLLCLAQTALAQTVMIKGLTFTLPDTFERYSKTGNDDAFVYRVEDDSHDVVQALAVGIGHCYDEEIRFGVSLDWIYEQLDKGDGEYIQYYSYSKQ